MPNRKWGWKDGTGSDKRQIQSNLVDFVNKRNLIILMKVKWHLFTELSVIVTQFLLKEYGARGRYREKYQEKLRKIEFFFTFRKSK